MLGLGDDRAHRRGRVGRKPGPEPPARSAMRSTTASWIASCMKARLVEPQDWPHQVKFMPRDHRAATSSGSASANAISAFLPPSSSSTGFSVSEAARITARPGRHAADQRHHGMPG